MLKTKSILIQLLSICCFVLMLTSCSPNTTKTHTEAEPSFVTQQPPLTVENTDLFIQPTYKINVEKNILYKEVLNSKRQREKLLLDIYHPIEASSGKRPAIIWIHGGGFTTGSKENAFESSLAAEFARKGYVCLSINYRLRENPMANWYETIGDATDDAAAAVDWLCENGEKYSVDTDRIAIGGHSAGSATAVNLCYKEDVRDAKWHKSSIIAVIALSEGELWLGQPRISDPPCIIIQGTADEVVPYTTSEQLADTLKYIGVSYRLHPIENGGHDLSIYFEEVVDVITQNMYQILTGKDAKIKIRTFNNLSLDTEYKAKPIDITVDGNLDEWKTAESVALSQLKDAGIELPDKDDFSGTAMFGWNPEDPERIYIAARIHDDKFQDTHHGKEDYWQDDSIEVIFNLMNQKLLTTTSMANWNFGGNGKELDGFATSANTEWKVIKKDSDYIYEAAINLTKAGATAPAGYRQFKAKANETIAACIQYNDCENNIREHQIGWIKGSVWNPRSFGKLIFVNK